MFVKTNFELLIYTPLCFYEYAYKSCMCKKSNINVILYTKLVLITYTVDVVGSEIFNSKSSKLFFPAYLRVRNINKSIGPVLCKLFLVTVNKILLLLLKCT